MNEMTNAPELSDELTLLTHQILESQFDRGSGFNFIAFPMETFKPKSPFPIIRPMLDDTEAEKKQRQIILAYWRLRLILTLALIAKSAIAFDFLVTIPEDSL